MEISVQNSNGRCAVTLGGELTIYAAGEMKNGLLGEFGDCAEVEINLSGVSEFDTAGLQVLMLAKREATAMNKSLRLVGHSRSVRELIELYSLAALFGDPLVIPAHELDSNANGGRA